MDNRVFNVNGMNKEMLIATLRLVFAQERGCYVDKDGNLEQTTAKGWMLHPVHGLILLWWLEDERDGEHAFISPQNAEVCAEAVWTWLQAEDTWEKSNFEDWDVDCDHDGHNSRGFRIYCDDWGHIGPYTNAICAIKPAYMWHGK